MSLRRLAATGVLATSGLLVLGGAAPALAVCDAYSQGCPSVPPTGGGSGVDVGGQDGGAGTGGGSTGGGSTDAGSGGAGGGGTAESPSTLPFTGGELVLLTAVGVGALAGGTALVVAGRRKSQPST